MKITVSSDFPTASSSSLHGANLDAIAFNMDFIARRDPQLATELLRVWRKAKQIEDR
ncbi:hypothetical protein [Amycolatopsis sp. H20-H5]|uniref:hypothetical protein n=1 Tax=Amycolatopsis sp. H20-H5 TaxID=3046309 RepID=UPI002DB7031F|nr:hypothetical protein [Amycolatopsis sp. H20-H5]MEC3974886.1 hypothetical protein [Amycolatopsis sp. H20-H5]